MQVIMQGFLFGGRWKEEGKKERKTLCCLDPPLPFNMEVSSLMHMKRSCKNSSRTSSASHNVEKQESHICFGMTYSTLEQRAVWDLSQNGPQLYPYPFRTTWNLLHNVYERRYAFPSQNTVRVCVCVCTPLAAGQVRQEQTSGATVIPESTGTRWLGRAD